MSQLAKTKIRHSVLSNRIMLARFGKDPNVALEHRDATPEFMSALLSFSLGDHVPPVGEGGQFTITGTDDDYEVTVRRVR